MGLPPASTATAPNPRAPGCRCSNVLSAGSEPTWEAARRYAELAESHGLSPAQMALAFVNSRPFLLSNIIGATSIEQLAQNLASLEVSLSDEVRSGIRAIHRDIPDPAP